MNQNNTPKAFTFEENLLAGTDSVLLKAYGIPPGRRFLSCAELAELFAVSAQHMERLCDGGELKAEAITGRKPNSVNYWRVPIPALLKFIKARTVRVKPPKAPAKSKKRPCKCPARPVQKA